MSQPYKSGRQQNLNLGITSVTESRTVLQTIGKVGIGTTNAEHYSLKVIGNTNINGEVLVSGISTFEKDVYVGENLYVQDSIVVDDIEAVNLNVTGIGTVNSLVSTAATISSLGVSSSFNVYAPESTFHENVVIQGNLTVNGTETIINVDEKYIKDKQIVLGFSTTHDSDDITANGGGIAIASEEGTPLVPFRVTGINTLPNTYKQLIWSSANTFGVGTTDAFLFNYAVGIGSTQVPNDVRLAVSQVQIFDEEVVAKYGSFTNLKGQDLDYQNAYIVTGIVTNISGTNVVYTNSDFTNLNADNGFIDVGIVTTLSGTDIQYTGVSTLTNLQGTNVVYTNSDFVNLNADNGFIVSGIITNITNERLVSGISTVTDLYATYSTIDNLTVDNAYISSGIITDISGTNVVYTNSDFVNLNADNGFIVSGIVTTLSGTDIQYTGVSTLTNLEGTNVVYTNSDFVNLNADNGFIDVGIVTTLSGTDLQYTGVSTLTNLEGTNVTYTNSDFTNLNADNGFIVSGIITNITNERLVSGIATITNLEGTNVVYTNSDFTNLNADNGFIDVGIVTTLSGTDIQYTGVSTLTNLEGTNVVYTNSDFVNLNADNGFIDVGIVTTLSGTDIQYTGISTFNITNTTTLYNSGVSTFVGVSDFQSDVNISENLDVTKGITADTIETRNLNVTGVGTVFNLVSTAATVTNLQGTNVVYTNSDFTNLNADNGFIDVGIVTTLSGTDLQYTGVSTLTNLQGTNVVYTNSDFTNLNADNGFIVSGIVTDLTNTRMTSGIATITNLEGTNVTYTNSDFTNLNADNGFIVSGIITNITNERLVSGIATITNLEGTNVVYTNSDFTNLNANNAFIDVGIVTTLSGTDLQYTGVSTLTNLQGTNVVYTNSDFTNLNADNGFIVSGIITNITNERLVSGIATITNLQGTNVTYTNSDFTNLNADSAFINVGIVTEISGTNLNYSGIGTIETLDTTNGSIDYLQTIDISNSGIITTNNLGVNDGFDVYAVDSVFHKNVIIEGNLTVNGTEVIINVDEKFIKDKQIVLGFSTTNDVTDTTANGGGFGIASTEGYPLVNFQSVGVNTLPETYKQLIWTKANTYGVGTTDAFLFNYAVGIGSTLVPNNVRLSVGNIQLTDKQINVETLEASRIVGTSATFTSADITNLHSNQFYSQSGIITDLSGTRLNYTGFGTITNLYSNVAYIENIQSNVGFTTAFTSERLNVTGVGTVFTLNTTNLSSTNSDFVNLNANNGFIDVGIITTLSSANATLENINSSGISTLNILRTNTINSIGVVTAPTFVGDLLGVANYANVSGFSTFSGYADAAGVSTFSGYADAAGVSTFSGYSNTSGFSTFSGYSDASGFSTFSGYADAAGVSTFSGYSNTSGFSTFSGYADVAGVSTSVDGGYANVNELTVSGVSTFSNLIDANGGLDVTGQTELDVLNVSGVSTFGQVQITTTGIITSSNPGITTVVYYGDGSNLFGVTAFTVESQPITGNPVFPTFASNAGVSSVGIASTQVAYIPDPGYFGIGITNPQATLHVVGDTILSNVRVTSSGIVTSSNPGVTTVVYYGDGSNLFGVTAFTVESQPITANPVFPTFASNAGVSSVGIASTQVVYVPNPGYLGLGTTVPQYTLDIVGNSRVSGVSSVNNLEIYGTVSAGNTVGSNGQYLRSTGVGVTWASFPTLRTTGSITATQGQTTFNFAYNVGFLDVYVNGVKLTSSEYTANNGATVVLVSPAFLGDIVEFVSYNTVSTSGSGGSGGANILNDLLDVSISSPLQGDDFVYDGTQWVNDYTVNTSTSTTSQTVIHTLSTSTYRSVEYMIQATQGTDYHLTKVLAIHDGTLVYPTEYGTLYTNSSLAAFDVDVSGGNMRLLVTPSSSSLTTYKIKFTAIKI
jgi:hypothetical protein